MNEKLIQALAAAAFLSGAFTVQAKNGADDPAGDQRHGRGADDPAGDVRHGCRADDPVGHK